MTPPTALEPQPVEAAAPARAELAISVKGLSKRFRIEKVRAQAPHARLASLLKGLVRRTRAESDTRYFWALQSVNLDVSAGERVAIIGRNGAGKSTLLKILSRIVPPTEGEARIRGRVASLLEVGVGFDGKLTGRENVFVNASLHGLSKAETLARYDQIVDFAGIDSRFLDMRIRHYSSGMRVRLAFSVAAHLDPDILMLDEVLAVGDAAFQEKCLERVEGLVRQKRTLLFVSHSMPAVIRFCDRAIWLEQGRIVMDDAAKPVVDAYTSSTVGSKSFSGWTRDPVEQDSGSATDPALSAISRPSDASAAPLEPEVLPDGTVKEPPGADLLSVRLINAARAPAQTVTADEAVGVEFLYEVLQSGKVVLPAAKFFNEDNVQMFSAVYTNPDYMQQPKEKGRYRSVVWIPPHLLNTGRVHVGVNLSTPTIGGIVRHVAIDRAFSFEVLDAAPGQPSARGTYKKLLGAVRPLLQWETSPED
jgi:lipopolysaccharide transport system ATP-binding protein